jgi:hypothetical protein
MQAVLREGKISFGVFKPHNRRCERGAFITCPIKGVGSKVERLAIFEFFEMLAKVLSRLGSLAAQLQQTALEQRRFALQALGRVAQMPQYAKRVCDLIVTQRPVGEVKNRIIKQLRAVRSAKSRD